MRRFQFFNRPTPILKKQYNRFCTDGTLIQRLYLETSLLFLINVDAAPIITIESKYRNFIIIINERASPTNIDKTKMTIPIHTLNNGPADTCFR